MNKLIRNSVLISCYLSLSSCSGIVKYPQNATLTVGIIAAFITALGWFVNEFMRKRNEDNRKKIDEKAKFIERQIEQFYGPLFCLVNQIVICNHVLYQINFANNKRSDTDREIINDFFQKNYFIPLHNEFNTILKNKLYLIDGSELPESIYIYLRHALQEHAQLTLWNDFKIDTSDVKGIHYPKELYTDIKNGLDNAMLKYSELTNILNERKDVKKIVNKKFSTDHLA
jgi:hypothetical protein